MISYRLLRFHKTKNNNAKRHKTKATYLIVFAINTIHFVQFKILIHKSRCDLKIMTLFVLLMGSRAFNSTKSVHTCETELQRLHDGEKGEKINNTAVVKKVSN